MKQLHSTIPGIILVAVFFCISLFVYKDYGISYDEPIQREIAQVAYNYIFHSDKQWLTYVEKDHGVAFELPLLMLEKAFQLRDTRDIFLMRHLVTHLFFLCSVFLGYLLILRLFKEQWLACMGLLMLLLCPRLYAHSYFNSKDMPFLSILLVAFYVAEIAFRKNRLQWYLLLGLVLGYATAMRILGIVPLAGVCILLLPDTFIKTERSQRLTDIWRIPIVLVGFCLAVYIAWPTLWNAPIQNFAGAYKSLSHFRWENNVFLNGKMERSTDLPWTYLPTWFSITIPLFWLLSGIMGMVLLVISLFMKPLYYASNVNGRNLLLYLFCFIVPVASVMLLKSVIYDDWRHLYFIYPSFVLMAVFAIDKLLATKIKTVVIGACIIQVIAIVFVMFGNHPFQQVYFNKLVSHRDEYLRHNFELDYWASSFKNGMEYVLVHDQSKQVRIFESGPEVVNARKILPAEMQNRIVFVDRNEPPYYFITNFRMHPGDFNAPRYYSIKVHNSTIMQVYKCSEAIAK